MRNFLIGIKNVLLWSYDRGSWQYDLLCLLIVAAIFLIPGRYFGDRDRGGSESLVNTRIEMSIPEDEVAEQMKKNAISAQHLNPVESALLSIVEVRCHCQARLLGHYETTRGADGRLVYKVWYRKR